MVGLAQVFVTVAKIEYFIVFKVVILLSISSIIYNFSVHTAKDGIIRDAQRPEGLEKIRQLEEAQPFQRPEIPEAVTRQRPVFTQPLQNIDHIAEGATAHFECRLIPVGDPTLKVEWFRNEKPLETSE